MKSIFTMLLLFMFMVPIADARTIDAILQDNDTNNKVNVTSNALDVNVKSTTDATHAALTTGQIITNITLDDSPTSTTGKITNAGYERVAVFFYLDETDSGNDTSGTISVDVSYDDSTYIEDVGFFNATDPTSNVTSITTNSGASTDENIAIIIPDSQAYPYIKVQVTGTGTAAGGDDQIVVDAYYSALE